MALYIVQLSVVDFGLGCAANIRFEATTSEYKGNIISLPSELNRFCSLLSHRSESADFTCETNKNGSEYFFLTEYFLYFASSKYFEEKWRGIFSKRTEYSLKPKKKLRILRTLLWLNNTFKTKEQVKILNLADSLSCCNILLLQSECT